MKKANNFIGIIAIVAIIGFSMAACNNGTTTDTITDTNPKSITITGIPGGTTWAKLDIFTDSALLIT